MTFTGEQIAAAISYVEGTLQAWSRQGPPENPRLSFEKLAARLDGVAAAARGFAADSEEWRSRAESYRQCADESLADLARAQAEVAAEQASSNALRLRLEASEEESDRRQRRASSLASEMARISRFGGEHLHETPRLRTGSGGGGSMTPPARTPPAGHRNIADARTPPPTTPSRTEAKPSGVRAPVRQASGSAAGAERLSPRAKVPGHASPKTTAVLPERSKPRVASPATILRQASPIRATAQRQSSGAVAQRQSSGAGAIGRARGASKPAQSSSQRCPQRQQSNRVAGNSVKNASTMSGAGKKLASPAASPESMLRTPPLTPRLVA